MHFFAMSPKTLKICETGQTARNSTPIRRVFFNGVFVPHMIEHPIKSARIERTIVLPTCKKTFILICHF